MDESSNPLLASDPAERQRLLEQLLSPDAVIPEEAQFNIARMMIDNGHRHAERLCMSFSDGVAATYGQMLACASDICTVLKENGIGDGDRLVLVVKPSLTFYATVMATWALGVVLVFVDPGMFWSVTKINHCIRLAKPKAWLRNDSRLAVMSLIYSAFREIPALIQLPNGLTGSFLQRGGEQQLLTVDAVSKADDALITFTTGSTGLPKMLVRTHAFLMRQTLGLAASSMHAAGLSCTPGETIPFPDTMVNTTNLPVGALAFIVLGAPCVLETNIMGSDVDSIVGRVRSARKTTSLELSTCIGSPAFLERIIRYCVDNNKDVPFNQGYLGGGPVYSHLALLLKKNLQECSVVYGSTEAEPISHITVQEKLEREDAVRGSDGDSAAHTQLCGHCVGKPVFPGGLAIIKYYDGQIPDDVLLEDLQLPALEPGEVVLRGWHVNMNEVPAKRLLRDRQGRQWLRMDDGAYLDTDGYIWLVGRMSWKVERNDKCFWSVVVEEQILHYCERITYVTYLQHKDRAYLFVEARHGLTETEEKGLQELIQREQIPVDEFRLMRHIPRDGRHHSKPNTGELFKPSLFKQWSLLLVLLLSVLVLLLAMVLRSRT